MILHLIWSLVTLTLYWSPALANVESSIWGPAPAFAGGRLSAGTTNFIHSVNPIPPIVQIPAGAGITEEILSILAKQAKAWNDRDLAGFMETYWKSEKLTFSGGGKTIRGWQATFDRYKDKYPPEKMGTLTFDSQEVTMLGTSAAMVLGNWHLKSVDEPVNGNFSLVMKKIDGQWKIIHDHSSTLIEE